ncbi:unnamed protein product [Schistosoma margrebowiei]|uniref:Uncharacterized protein n=1 Tax=Schistosoma margrebowiei TaxID=48269 RepID=A0A183ML02_9TREM|nr:unnamed protein product [Schistosoma margrebowiei]
MKTSTSEGKHRIQWTARMQLVMKCFKLNNIRNEETVDLQPNRSNTMSENRSYFDDDDDVHDDVFGSSLV